MQVAIVAAAWTLMGMSAPALAEPVSLQCNMSSPDDGNFSGEPVYVILDLDGHSVVSGYGDPVMHDREKTSTLTEDPDRLSWRYEDDGNNYSWIVDYVLDRSTLKLMASAGGTNISGATNSGNVTYACSKVHKQI